MSAVILQHTNIYGEKFYFMNLGLPWPHDMTKRLIERTTDKRDEATILDNEDAAKDVLVKAGSPRGWEILPA